MKYENINVSSIVSESLELPSILDAIRQVTNGSGV